MSRGARRWCTALAVVACAATVVGPLDDAGRRSLVGHMLQHLSHTDVVAPLLVLGLPGLIRPLRPVPAAVLLAASLAGIWLIHLTPLFELSLERTDVHWLVHGLFIVCGVLMWTPVFDPGRLPGLARMAYVFAAIPLAGLIGFVLHVARAPLYPHYVATCGGGALADQQVGADVMWIGGCLLMFCAFLAVALEYLLREERLLRAGEERP